MTLTHHTIANTEVAPSPRAPAGLGEHGQALWAAVAGASWFASTDMQALANLARLADIRAQLEQAIADRGVVLEEPIVSPTGKVVGTRLVTNCAVSSLCSVDRRMAEGLNELGFTAKARAQLGFIVTSAEKLQLEVDRFLNTKFERNE